MARITKGLGVRKVHRSIYDYCPGHEYKIGKYKYCIKLVNIDIIDNVNYYTYNIFRKRFIFWYPIEAFSGIDDNKCRKECDDYLKLIYLNDER